MEITIPYKPRKWTKDFHKSSKRWFVLVLARRSGKTHASLNHLLRAALTTTKSNYAYIAPYYKQAKTIAWDILKEYSRVIPGIVINESELKIVYPNGSQIRLYGADNPDALRGIALWGVVFDEYSQQPRSIFTEIIRPALADHKGFAIFIGTPKGRNEFYNIYKHAKKNDKWYSAKLTWKEVGELDPQEVQEAQELMSEDEFNQEFNCSFDASIKGAYYSKQIAETRKAGRITKVVYDQSLPVHTWWDLGMSDATSIGFFQVYGNEWRLIDYYENEGEGLKHYVQHLNDKEYMYGSHYFPHDVAVRELGTGKSRQETLERMGVKVSITPNLPINDGIQAVRTRFNTLWIDDKLVDVVDMLSQYHKEFDEKKGIFKDRPSHDYTSHCADMFRYWAVTEHYSPTGKLQTEY